MDEKPFLEFNIQNLKESVIHEIVKFHKLNFDINKIVNNASSLKYTKGIKKVLTDEFTSPSNEFVKLFASKVYTGRLTANVMEEFTDLVQKAISQIISEKVSDRLSSALIKEEEKQQEEEREPEIVESKVVTTEEELDAYRIVVAILRRKLSIDRIVHRDTQSYFGILLDNNNRKPICRLHLNGNNKYLGLINEDKSETKEPINSINEIYNFDKILLQTVDYYEKEQV
jgi:hypothetical protein